MQPPIALPGLDRLISTCRAHHLDLKLAPPLDAAAPQDLLLGQPLDPVLAAALLRHNGMSLADWGVLPLNEGSYGLGPFNARMRRHDEGPLRELLLFGVFSGLAYYLATVPSLADGNGLQPVVYVSDYDGMGILPIASNVDRAFDLYARYLNAKIARDASLIAQYGSLKMGYMAQHRFLFPRSIPAFVAEDRKLIEMLEANRFDAFTSVDAELPEWSASIRRAAREQVEPV